HVLVGAEYSQSPQGAILLRLNPKPDIKLKTSDAKTSDIQLHLSQPDIDRASADVAMFDSGIKAPCHLEVADSDKTQIGEHLLAIGYPSLSPAPVLYEGFLSAKHQHLPIPIGHVGSNSIFPTYQVMRVQMPITPGASGSPLIDDSNRAIGIISEVPVL